ncbi:glycosyltransferase family 2 protein [Streptococcus cameli]
MVPVYNVAPYIRECLDSVLQQTYTEIEILVVDDRSTDRSAAICMEYAEKDNRIQFVQKSQNTGLSDARNIGIANASGEYLTFVDSDDKISPTFVERLLAEAQKHDADLVFCDQYDFVEERSAFLYYSPLFANGVVSLKDYLFQRCTGQRAMLFSAWGKLYHSSLFQGHTGIHFPYQRIHEDAVAVPRLFMKSKKVMYIEEALYCYRKRSGSITNRKRSLKQIEDNLYLTEQFILDMLIADQVSREIMLTSYKAVCTICKRQLEESDLTHTSIYKGLLVKMELMDQFVR